MVQNAIVKEVVSEGVVRVSLLRQMECGLHCDGACEGCGQKPKEEILALAADTLGTKPGDFVEVEPYIGGNISISVIVFLFPCIGLALGYVLGQTLLGLGEGMALLTALAGLVFGFLPAFFLNRSMSKGADPEFRILKYLY